MKTVGEILKSAREIKSLSIEEVSVFTKINIKYLRAIEENNFHALPPAAFTKGFLHSYATSVGINPDSVLAVFRRDYDQDDRGRIIVRGLTAPQRKVIPTITPKLVSYIFGGIVTLLVLAFFVWQITNFFKAPTLTVFTPESNLQSQSPITVSGKTDPTNSVLINNKPVKVADNGEFTEQLSLIPGPHSIIIVSTNRAGKKTSLEKSVIIVNKP